MSAMIRNVLTITLNPTVDKSCTVENIKPEKKMRCSQPKYEPGGGGINVSRGLLRLDVPSTAFFLAGGRTGERLKELLAGEKVAAFPFQTSAETRENFIVTDTANNEQYRFGMPGEEITPAEAEAIFGAIQNLSPFPEIVIISGSMPPGISPQYLRKLTALVKEKGAKVIADTSGDSLKELVEEGVYMLKPNLGELSRLSGIETLDNESADDAAYQIIQDGKAEIVVVSMGAGGAYLVTKDERFYTPAPSVKKLSTVGAGDSMVAGMASILAKGGTYREMLNMGVACGTAATMNPGTGLFKKEDTERLYRWLTKNNA